MKKLVIPAVIITAIGAVTAIIAVVRRKTVSRF